MFKLLIADDVESSRKCLAKYLGRNGYQVLEASDGDEALRSTRMERPDLAIVDLLMPVMDGFEYVREVRKDPEIAKTPIIFLSANFPTDDLRPIANALGVEHILQKTLFQTPILDLVRKTAASAELREIEVHEPDFQRQHLRLISEKLAREYETLASSFIDFLAAPPDVDPACNTEKKES